MPDPEMLYIKRVYILGAKWGKENYFLSFLKKKQNKKIKLNADIESAVS